MVVDTSAAMAVLVLEPEAAAIRAVLDAGEPALMSAAGLLELGMVLEGRIGPEAAAKIARFLREGGVEIVAVERAHADRALEGWRRFGKGRHPAALNFGDCFTYALAATAGLPVLCVGDDFARTDVAVVDLGMA